jgi:gluconokinase
MGVSGSGKSEFGKRLATRLGVAYAEGDDYHKAENIAKMKAGSPLTDADRTEWLQTLQWRIGAAKESGESLVLSCSSLKRRYRDFLRQGDPFVVFIHLAGDSELIGARMRARTDHFMPLGLLASQFRDLEPPERDERAISLDIRKTLDQLIAEVLLKIANTSKFKTNN